MKLNIQWKKVLYGIALIVISIILAALHFIVAGKGIGYFTSSIIAVISVSTWDSSVSFPNFIGFLVVALVAVGLVFNTSGVKDVLLQLFNKIIGA